MFEKTQEEIMENWGNSSEPLVSVGCITYNHKNYIEEAIQSFLMQETDFPFEVIIHDDASTDDTPKIIKRYAKNYPKIIKPIYQKENQYSQINGPIYPRFVYPKCKGKYIALCEGDDYWTDPLKLQKQVDILENHPECSGSYHPTRILENFKKTNIIVGNRKQTEVINNNTISNLFNPKVANTSSLLFRTMYVKNPPDFLRTAPVGDTFLILLLMYKGKVAYIDDVMSIRRLSVSSSWSAIRAKNLLKKIKDDIKIIQYLDKFNRYSKYQYSNDILKYKIAMKLKLLRYGSTTTKIKFLNNSETKKHLSLLSNVEKLYFLISYVIYCQSWFFQLLKILKNNNKTKNMYVWLIHKKTNSKYHPINLIQSL